jgi:hypothetical protein
MGPYHTISGESSSPGWSGRNRTRGMTGLEAAMSTPSSRPSIVHFTTKRADGKGDGRGHVPVIRVAA